MSPEPVVSLGERVIAWGPLSMRGAAIASATAWIAMAAYAVALAAMLLSRWDISDHPRRRLARWIWTAALGLLLIHLAAAFHLVHAWSHRAAVESTARATREAFGFAYGGGVWWNYAFAVVWCVDVGWWWRGDVHYRERPRYAALLIHGAMAFIVLCATVVFTRGPAQAISAVVALLIAGVALNGHVRRRARE